MEGYTQADRFIRIETPLGGNVLLLEAFSGREAISELFSYRLDVLSVRPDIVPDEIVGRNISFLVQTANGSDRYFNGHVQGIAGGESEGGRLRRYTLDVVPWLWFLTRTTDCRIFQEKTAPEIIEQIFADLGFPDYRLDLQADHPKREYCVQYRESDFAFVSRLMEEEGIFYYFAHESGKHTLVLADHKATHKFCPEHFIQYNRGSLREDHISRWEHRWEFRTGKWAQTDYNFKKPSTNLMTTTSTLVTVPQVDKYEVYDYPGLYKVKGDGDALTKLRMEMEEAGFDNVSAASTCRSLHAGGKFMLSKHATPQEEGGIWMITAIEQHASCPVQLAGGAQGEQSYDNAFTCMPDTVVFRPELKTPKPVLHGLQTAVVTGPAGEEIYPDEYGRVKVQFHWDREGQKDEHSSCWMRVAQQIAGKGWGFQSLPRIGQEVVVAFLEGDPDRPMVIGSVYNDENKPPFALPDNKTQTGFKSQSSKGGGGSNEIRFEDKKGQEELYIHSQKDRNEHVKNNMATTVEVDQALTVIANRTKTVQGNETIGVDGDRSAAIGGDNTLAITGSYEQTVDGSRDQTVKGTETIGVDGDQTVNANANQTVNVGAVRTVNTGADQEVNVGGNDKLVVSAERSVEASAAYKLTAPDVTIDGLASITLAVGGSSIKIDPSGVTIMAPMIKLN